MNKDNRDPLPRPAEASGIAVDVPSIEQEFRMLVSKWRSETRVLSSIQAKVFNRNYQRIMAMGKAVLPLIFADLMNNGGQWYWALECITGDNPSMNARTVQEAKSAWLEYAVQHRYLGAHERRN
jgi:hypothetical protein